MTRMIALSLLLLFHFSLNAQDRHLRNAKDALEENDNLKAVERLAAYYSKKGATPPYYYVKYLLELKKATTPSEHDSAYRFLSLATDGLSGLDAKEQDEWCKEIGFCNSKLAAQRSSLDTAVFSAYAKSPTLEMINQFLATYPQSPMVGQAQIIKGHLTYLDAQRENTEVAYALYLSLYPDGTDAPEARKNMWALGYAAAKKINTIASFQTFIEKYPGAALVKDAETAITTIAWDQAKIANTIRAYEDFLKKYPGAPQQQEAQNKIWDLAWEAALRVNTKQAFREYAKAYPSSPKTEMANAFIENITWKEALASGSAQALEDFITAYPSSKNINAARKELEQMEWNSAKNEFQLSAIQAFLDKYPSSPFREEAEKLIEDIRSEILPYLTQNKMYRLFNVVTNRFVSDQEYEKVSVLKGGLFIVQQNGKKGLINKEGKNLILMTYDCVEQLNTGLFKVSLSEKYGVVDQEGEFVIDLNYNSLDTLSGGGYIFSKATGEEVKFGLLDANGKVVLDGKYDGLSFIHDNLFIATTKDYSYLINRSGTRLGTLNFSYANLSGKDRIIAAIKNKYGILDLNGTTILPFNYEYIMGADTGWFVTALPGNKKSICNRMGKEALPPTPSEVSHLTKNIFVVSKMPFGTSPQKYFLYDAGLKKPITNAVYDEIMEISEGLMAFRLNEQAGYMDETGKIIIEPRNSDFWTVDEEELEHYEEGDEGEGEEDYCYSMSPYAHQYSTYYPIYNKSMAFSEGLAVLFTSGKKGYIDRKGKIVIPVIYDEAYPFMNGIANVAINGQYKILNKKGEAMVEGYKIYSFTEDKKTAVLTHIETNDKALLDMTTMEIKELPAGISAYFRFERYGIGQYKDVYAFIPHGGEMLMDSKIDFTDYEANTLINEATLQYDQENYTEAISWYEKALAFESKKAEALLGLARSYIGMDDKSRGKDYLDKLINLQPDYAQAYEDRAALCYETKQYYQALEDYQKAIEYGINPTSFIYFRIAYCHANQGNHREAIETYTLCINQNSGDHSAYNNRGNSYRQLREYTAALKDYTSAINNAKDADNDSNGMYYNNRGILYIELKKNPEACSDFRKALSFGNENASNNIRKFCK